MTTIINKLRAEIAERQAKITEIQDECSHPLSAREAVNKGNTGNWDHDDYYWTDHHCTLCDKRWQTDQGWDNKRNGGDGRGMPGWKKASR